jgi:hypothetical protein
MNTDRLTFIRALFSYLENKNYIWLKATSETPETVPANSDIDLLIREDELEAVFHFIQNSPQVACCKSREENGVRFLQLLFNDGGCLKLDLLTNLIRKQWTYLTGEYLFENRIRRNGAFTYRPEVLLEHVLFFNFLNHSGLPEKYLDFFSEMPAEEQQRILHFICQKYGLAFSSIEAMGSYDRAVRRRLVSYLKKMPENFLLRRLHSGAAYFTKNIMGRHHFSNEVITFS